MPRSLALTSAFLIIVVGLTLSLAVRQKSDSDLKDQSLQPYKQIIPHTSKLLPQISALIKNENENYKPEIDETIHLTAEIQLNAPADKIKFQWILPDGLRAMSASSGEFSLQDWRQTIKIPITIKNQTTDNQKVFIKTSAFRNGQAEQITNAQYDTQLFLEQAEEQEQILKRQNEYLQSLPAEAKKFK